MCPSCPLLDVAIEPLHFAWSYKKEIIEKTGGKDDKGQYAGMKDEDVTANLMIGDPSTGKKGKAFGLKDRLNNFIAELNKTAGTN